MATVAVASSGHSLSVLTNACIKQPAKSRVKHKVTNYGMSNTGKSEFVGVKTVNFDDGFVPEMSSPGEVVSRWTLQSDFDTSPTKDVHDEDLGSLSDDEFFKRLMQLKQEHKKKMQLWEKLYRQKLASEVEYSVDFDRDNIVEDDSDNVLNGLVSSSAYLAESQEKERENVKPRDRIKDLSSKPPIPAGPRHQAVQPDSLNRPFSAPVRRQNLSRSLDVDDWRLMAQRIQVPGGVSYFNEETQSEIYDPREAAAAVSRIEDMWENFSVEDYAPRRRNSSRPSSAHSDIGRKQPKKKEWRHRITIPKPFEMMLRDSNTEKPKSKTQILHEQEILKKHLEEEAECQKKFTATPVPAHVYLPLFDEYNEKNEARRRYVKHYRQELLKSIERPFKFMSREEEKKHRKMLNSMPITDDVEHRPQFRAKPVPDYLYDSSNEDKAIEEQEYRRIRIKMRSQEMLKSASLPPSMEARQKMKEQRLKEEKKKTRTRRRKFVPRINGEVPDYDELYRQFQKELQKKKLGKEATVVEPFKLRTGKIPSKKEKILNDVKRDEESSLETRWPYRNPRTTPRKSFVSATNMTSSLDSIPHRTSSSAEMRFNKGRTRALSLTQRELEEIEYHKRQRQKEMKLRREIMERTTANERDLQPRPTREEKLREYRESERARMKEYRQSLEDIKQRVNQRPLLFEQVKQANAKKAAEKRYSRTLRDHGLDETYIQQKSSLSTGVDTDADDYEMDDRSYSYSYSGNRDQPSGDEETVVKVNTRDSEDQLSA